MSTETVYASPTKRFFVQMLTRDIELKDAILDLIDNCLDGVLRIQKKQQKNKKSKSITVSNDRPFEGYWAKITATPSHFEIQDNCGGIPRKTAIESAFMLGRPSLTQDKDIETVGMYGIGMKRAIFKMGRKCSVTSQPKTGSTYRVTISPSWLKDENDWNLSLDDVESEFEELGTKINIGLLNEGIKHHFNKSTSPFLGELRSEISQLYAIIIDKGFQVFLNEELITPADLTLMVPRPGGGNGIPKIKPYIFKGTIDEVDVELSVGFYRSLATIAELEDEQETPRSKDNAGWTVMCNDRIVLHADKSEITGWGTATVPRYHNQFISIAGVVSFRSKSSTVLPLNTTKRGLDTTSRVYLFVLDIMREGMKKFTNFTNKWKAREVETNAQFQQMESRKISDVAPLFASEKWSNVRKAKGRGSALKFSPNLPMPAGESVNKRISFVRPKKEIELVSEYIFDDRDVNPSEVGENCFDGYLKEAKE